MKPQVILVHGLWMTGLEMSFIESRLRRCGFDVHRFPYADLRNSPAENARRLHSWLQEMPTERRHFVGHSLGGIVLLHLFHQFPEQLPGRVVLLGSPVRGSEAARRMSRIAGLKGLLGKSLENGLGGDVPPWSGERDLGVVAGTLGLGFGQLFGGLEKPHDGTVSVAETRIEKARDFLPVKTSHMGMLVSSIVTDQICAFLHDGRFRPS